MEGYVLIEVRKVPAAWVPEHDVDGWIGMRLLAKPVPGGYTVPAIAVIAALFNVASAAPMELYEAVPNEDTEIIFEEVDVRRL